MVVMIAAVVLGLSRMKSLTEEKYDLLSATVRLFRVFLLPMLVKSGALFLVSSKSFITSSNFLILALLDRVLSFIVLL